MPYGRVVRLNLDDKERIQRAGAKNYKGKLEAEHVIALTRAHYEKTGRELVHCYPGNSTSATWAPNDERRRNAKHHGLAVPYENCFVSNKSHKLNFMSLSIPTMGSGFQVGSNKWEEEVKHYFVNLYLYIGQGRDVIIPCKQEREGMVCAFANHGGIAWKRAETKAAQKHVQDVHNFIQGEFLKLHQFATKIATDREDAFKILSKDPKYKSAFEKGEKEQDKTEKTLWLGAGPYAEKESPGFATGEKSKPFERPHIRAIKTYLQDPDKEEIGLTLDEKKGICVLNNKSVTAFISRDAITFTKYSDEKALKEAAREALRVLLVSRHGVDFEEKENLPLIMLKVRGSEEEREALKKVCKEDEFQNYIRLTDGVKPKPAHQESDEEEEEESLKNKKTEKKEEKNKDDETSSETSLESSSKSSNL